MHILHKHYLLIYILPFFKNTYTEKGKKCTVSISVSITIYYCGKFELSIGNASAHAHTYYCVRYLVRLEVGLGKRRKEIKDLYLARTYAKLIVKRLLNHKEFAEVWMQQMLKTILYFHLYLKRFIPLLVI